MRSKTLQRAMFVFVGGLLIVAATLKVAELTIHPSAKSEWMNVHAIGALVIAIEGFLGLWMISGVFERAAWKGCIASLVVFAAVSSAKALSGEESCGCFGRVTVSPVMTLLLDLGLIVALARCRPPRDVRGGESCEASARGWDRFRLRRALGAVLTLVVAMSAALVLSPTSRIVDIAGIAAEGELVVLRPQEWLDQAFPLVPYIDTGDAFAEGHWELLLYHNNCPDCQKALARMAQRSVIGVTEQSRQAAIEVPPYGSVRSVVEDRGRVLFRKLSDKYDWFVETPLLVSLVDGRVVSVRAGISVLIGDAAQLNVEQNNSGMIDKEPNMALRH